MVAALSPLLTLLSILSTISFTAFPFLTAFLHTCIFPCIVLSSWCAHSCHVNSQGVQGGCGIFCSTFTVRIQAFLLNISGSPCRSVKKGRDEQPISVRKIKLARRTHELCLILQFFDCAVISLGMGCNDRKNQSYKQRYLIYHHLAIKPLRSVATNQAWYAMYPKAKNDPSFIFLYHGLTLCDYCHLLPFFGSFEAQYFDPYFVEAAPIPRVKFWWWRPVKLSSVNSCTNRHIPSCYHQDEPHTCPRDSSKGGEFWNLRLGNVYNGTHHHDGGILFHLL